MAHRWTLTCAQKEVIVNFDKKKGSKENWFPKDCDETDEDHNHEYDEQEDGNATDNNTFEA